MRCNFTSGGFYDRIYPYRRHNAPLRNCLGADAEVARKR